MRPSLKDTFPVTTSLTNKIIMSPKIIVDKPSIYFIIVIISLLEVFYKLYRFFNDTLLFGGFMISYKYLFASTLLITSAAISTNAMNIIRISRPNQQSTQEGIPGFGKMTLGSQNGDLAFCGDKIALAKDIPEDQKTSIELQFKHLDASGNEDFGNNCNCVELMPYNKGLTKAHIKRLALHILASIKDKSDDSKKLTCFNNQVLIMDIAEDLANQQPWKKSKNGPRIYLQDQQNRQAFLCCKRGNEVTKKPIFLQFYCVPKPKEQKKTEKMVYNKVVLMCGTEPATPVTEEEQNAIINRVHDLVVASRTLGAINAPTLLDRFSTQLYVMNKGNSEIPRKLDGSCEVIFEDTSRPKPVSVTIAEKQKTQNPLVDFAPEFFPAHVGCVSIQPEIKPICRAVQKLHPTEKLRCCCCTTDFAKPEKNTPSQIQSLIRPVIEQDPNVELIKEPGNVIYEQRATMSNIPVHVKQFYVNPHEEPTCRFHDAFNLLCLMLSKEESAVKKYLEHLESQESFKQDLESFFKAQNKARNNESADTKDISSFAYTIDIHNLISLRLQPRYLKNLIFIDTNHEQKREAAFKKAKENLSKGAPQALLLDLGSRWIGIKIEQQQNGSLLIWTTNSNENEDITNEVIQHVAEWWFAK